MAVSSVESLTNKDTNKTWKEDFDNVRKGTQEYEKLRDRFKEFVTDHESFSKSMEQEFDDFLKSLDDISKSWDTINEKIDDTNESFNTMGVTAEEIRRVFADIAVSTTSVAQQLSIQRSTVLKIQNLAGDLSRVYSVEGQFQQKNLNRLIQKAGMLKDEYEFRAKILTGGSLDEKVLESTSELHRKNLSKLENQLKVAESSVNTSRAQIVDLKRRIDLEKVNLEYLAKGNLEHVQRLELLAKINKEIRKGVVKDNRGVSQVAGLTTKLAGFLGLSDVQDQIKDIKENFLQKASGNRFAAKIAQEESDKAKKDKKSSKDAFVKVVNDQQSVDPDIWKRVKEYRRYSLDIEARQVDNKAKGVDSDADTELQNLIKQREALGLSKDVVAYLNTYVGASKKAVDTHKDLNTTLKAENQEHNLGVQACKEMLSALKGSITSVWMLAALVGKALWSSFTAVDNTAVQLQREIGTWEGSVAGANSQLATSKDYLEQAFNISKKFHIDAAKVFTPEEIARAAEFKNLSNLTADQVSTLAVRAKTVGTNVTAYSRSMHEGYKTVLASTNTAASYGAVLEEAASASDALSMSLGNNPKKLAEAAAAAVTLGMSLKDMEGVANNLLNFESSIEAEMEAQLLTGHQMNLAKAREYALNNDMAGLSRELLNNGVRFEEFSRMNYVQQNSLAKALGMSREQLAGMVRQQVLAMNISDEQKQKMLNMNEEDYRRMTTEQQWQQTKEKFLQSLVPLMKPVVDILTMIISIARPITALIGKAVTLLEGPINVLQKFFSTVQKFFGDLFSGFGKSKKGAQDLGSQVQEVGASVQKAGASPLSILVAANIGIVIVVKAVKLLVSALRSVAAVAKLCGVSLKSAFLAPIKGVGSLVRWVKHLSEAFRLASVYGNTFGQKVGTVLSESGGKLGQKLGNFIGNRKSGDTRGIIKRTFSRAKSGITGAVRDAYNGTVGTLTGSKELRGKKTGRSAEAMRRYARLSRKGMLPGSQKAISESVPKLDTTLTQQATEKSKGAQVVKSTKGFANSKVLQGAAAMVLVAGSLWVLAQALQAMKGVEWKQFYVMAASLGVLTLAVMFLGNVGQEALKGAAALALMGLALIPLAFSLKILQGVDWSHFGMMAAAIAAFSVEMIALGALLSVAAPFFAIGVVAVIAVSAAMAALAGALLLMSKVQGIEINVKSVGKQVESLVSVASSLGVFGFRLLKLTPALLFVALGLKPLVVAFSAVRKALNTIKDLPSVNIGTAKKSVSDLVAVSESLSKIGSVRLGRVVRLGAALSLLSKFKDTKIASGIDQISDALLRFSSTLNALNVEKFNKLSVRRIKALAKVQAQSQQVEGVQGSYEATVQTRAVVDSKKQTKDTEKSQKSADLSVIEKKLDVIVKAIESSRPSWNWLEFDKAAATAIPGWQR